MHSLITSYLLQSKECILPGIGILRVVNTPASTDTANGRILPPFEAIMFKNEDRPVSSKLVKYIADQKHVSESEAKDLLDDFCKDWKEKITEGGKLDLESVGSIQKNGTGSIIFEKEAAFSFLQPIAVNSVYQRTGTPESSVVSEVPLPVTVNENREPEDVVVERSYWGLWALILLAIGFVMLFYHYKAQKLTGASVANQHRYTIDSAGTTYRLAK